VTLGTFRSPLTPLKKGGTGIKVPLFKGDLEGSKTCDTDKRTFQTSSKVESFVGVHSKLCTLTNGWGEISVKKRDEDWVVIFNDQ